jgi:hypothetical protein
MPHLPAVPLPHPFFVNWSNGMHRVKRAATVAGAGALMFAQVIASASGAVHIGTRSAVSPFVAPAAQTGVARQLLGFSMP